MELITLHAIFPLFKGAGFSQLKRNVTKDNCMARPEISLMKHTAVHIL